MKGRTTQFGQSMPIFVVAVLLELMVIVPILLLAAAAWISGATEKGEAEIWSQPVKCSVRVLYVEGYSRSGAPLNVVTDSGDCPTTGRFPVSYRGVPVEERVEKGRLPVEIGSTDAGIDVARVADSGWDLADVQATYRVATQLAVVGAMLQALWLILLGRIFWKRR